METFLRLLRSLTHLRATQKIRPASPCPSYCPDGSDCLLQVKPRMSNSGRPSESRTISVYTAPSFFRKYSEAIYRNPSYPSCDQGLFFPDDIIYASP